MNTCGLGGSLMGHTLEKYNKHVECRPAVIMPSLGCDRCSQTGKPVRPALLLQQCPCRKTTNTLYNRQPMHLWLLPPSFREAHLLVSR